MVRFLGSPDRIQTRIRLIALGAALAAFNAAAWFAVVQAARTYPMLLALGVTAFVLGLRHAVDPDHIAAIDGTTRKLMHDGQRPVAVGFFFSLGHSTIVFVLSLLVAAFGTLMVGHLPALRSAGALAGTIVSALFLFVIAAANIVVLLDVLRGSPDGDPLPPGGLLTRFLRPALGMVKQSWHMYPLGVLFGLGFDTASEVALLGISAASGAGGMPIVYILLLPCIFAAGMTSIDTLEGMAMLGAYGWAYVRPARKVLYNFNMTLISIVIALFIGFTETAAAIGTHTGSPLAHFGDYLSFTSVGIAIIAIFAINLGASVLVYRGRYLLHVKSMR